MTDRNRVYPCGDIAELAEDVRSIASSAEWMDVAGTSHVQPLATTVGTVIRAWHDEFEVV